MELASSLWPVATFPLQEVPLTSPPPNRKKDLTLTQSQRTKAGDQRKGQCLLSFISTSAKVESPTLRIQVRPTPICGNVPRDKSCWSHLPIMKQFSSVRRCLTSRFHSDETLQSFVLLYSVARIPHCGTRRRE